MFLAAFLSFLLYALVFLRIRGNVVRNGWRMSFRKRDGSGATTWPDKISDGQALRVAKQMSLYERILPLPLLY